MVFLGTYALKSKEQQNGDAAVTNSLQFSILEQFTKGSRVEVISDEEGFKGAWYIATILDPNPKKKPQKLYVEYQSLLDEDGSKPLREFVNLEFLRPIPPPEPEKTQCFQLNDVVDALYRDEWWTGVIIRVLDNSRFVVDFQNPPDLIEFGVSELRVHRQWVCGKWIQPEKKPMVTFHKI